MLDSAVVVFLSLHLASRWIFFHHDLEPKSPSWMFCSPVCLFRERGCLPWTHSHIHIPFVSCVVHSSTFMFRGMKKIGQWEKWVARGYGDDYLFCCLGNEVNTKILYKRWSEVGNESSARQRLQSSISLNWKAHHRLPPFHVWLFAPPLKVLPINLAPITINYTIIARTKILPFCFGCCGERRDSCGCIVCALQLCCRRWMGMGRADFAGNVSAKIFWLQQQKHADHAANLDARSSSFANPTRLAVADAVVWRLLTVNHSRICKYTRTIAHGNCAERQMKRCRRQSRLGRLSARVRSPVCAPCLLAFLLLSFFLSRLLQMHI